MQQAPISVNGTEFSIIVTKNVGCEFQVLQVICST